MNETERHSLKSIYLGVSVPDDQVKQGWENLQNRLPDRQNLRLPVWQYSMVFASVLVLVIAGVIFAAQTVIPGSPLYPVKQYSHAILNSFSQPTEKNTATFKAQVAPVKLLIKLKPSIRISPIVNPTYKNPNESGKSYKGNSNKQSKQENINSGVKGVNSVRGENADNRNNEIIHGETNGKKD